MSLKLHQDFRRKKISFEETLTTLKEKNYVKCNQIRYDFKNTKISSGLFGINRILIMISSCFF